MSHGTHATVKIKSSNPQHVGGFLEISASDYDPTLKDAKGNALHVLFTKDDEAALAKASADAAKAAAKKGGKVNLPAMHAGLLGSDAFAASVKIKEGKEMPLGDLVVAAQKRSGLTVEQWNGLSQDVRDKMLTAEVEAQAAW